MTAWPLIPLARGFREKDERSTEGAEELLGLTRERGVVKRADIEQRASVSNSYAGYKLVAVGDLVVNKMQAWNGVLGRSPYAGMTSPDYTVLKSTGLWDVAFVAFVLRTPHFIVEMAKRSKGIGTGFLRLYTPDLLGIKVPCPPMSEQLALMKRLDSETARVDALIDRKQRFVELLLEKRSTLITQAVTVGTTHGAELEPTGSQWLASLPQGWHLLPLKRWVAAKITDGPHETPELLDEGVDFISAEAVQEGAIDFDRRRGYISEELHRQYCRKCRPARDDIFFCKSGATTGKIALVRDDREFSVWSPLALIRADKRKILPSYLFLALQSDYFQRQVEQTWTYGTQPNIGMGTIERLLVAAPNLGDQQLIVGWFVQQAQGIDALVYQTRRSIDLLREYRTALISAAVTGQIDIPGTETSEDVA